MHDRFLLPGYVVEKLLGTGSLAKVYHVSAAGRDFACKVFDKRHVARLERVLDVKMEKHILMLLSDNDRSCTKLSPFADLLTQRENSDFAALPPAQNTPPVKLAESSGAAIKEASAVNDSGTAELQAVHAQGNCVADHIARLHSSGRAENYVYLLLDFCPYGELFKYVNHRPIEDRQLFCALAMQLVRGLALVHARGVLHRDLKTENIGVCRDQIDGVDSVVLKYFDFGSAVDITLPQSVWPFTYMGRGSSRKKLVHYVGSPNFMPPERIRNLESTAASDVFSLGCVLYHIAVGYPPFFAASEYITFLRIEAADLDFPCYLDEQAKALVTSCLRAAPADRPTLDELEARIARTLHAHDFGAGSSICPFSAFYLVGPLASVQLRFPFYVRRVVNHVCKLNAKPQSTFADCVCGQCATKNQEFFSAAHSITAPCKFAPSAALLRSLFGANTLLVAEPGFQLKANAQLAKNVQLAGFDCSSELWTSTFELFDNLLAKAPSAGAPDRACQRLATCANLEQVTTLCVRDDTAKTFVKIYTRILVAAIITFAIYRDTDELYEQLKSPLRPSD